LSRGLQALILGVLASVFAVAGVYVYQWRAAEGTDARAAAQVLLSTPLRGLDDQSISIAQWRGKVLVVNFWATWCAPCREEIPLFMKLQNQYADRGVQFLGVAVDQKARVAPYAKEMQINYPLLIGGIEAIELARQAGNRAGVLPFTVIVGRDGAIANRFVGIVDTRKLEALLAPLL
jgi:thiol-disulfide isomerase/thioredoxin